MRGFHPGYRADCYAKIRSIQSRAFAKRWKWESSRLGAATEQTIGDMMRSPVTPVRETADAAADRRAFSDRLEQLSSRGGRAVALAWRGGVAGFEGASGGGAELTAVIAWDLMRPIPPCLTPGQKLLDAAADIAGKRAAECSGCEYA